MENIYFLSEINIIKKKFFIKIISYSEVPNGSGLGGSPTLVAVMSALLKYLNINLSKKQLVEDAIFLEICKIPGGYQDQYGCLWWLNFIEFKNRNVFVSK